MKGKWVRLLVDFGNEILKNVNESRFWLIEVKVPRECEDTGICLVGKYPKLIEIFWESAMRVIYQGIYGLSILFMW